VYYQTLKYKDRIKFLPIKTIFGKIFFLIETIKSILINLFKLYTFYSVMEKNIEDDKSDLLIALKKVLRTKGMSENFKNICKKAVDIIKEKVFKS